jgi:hypothetical protein
MMELEAVELDGEPVDLADVLADVTIRHGRTGYFDSASPSTCQVTLLGVDRELTSGFRLGGELVVSASLDGAPAAPRFTGKVTDAGLDVDVLTVIAVGRLSTLSGYTIGAGAYPEELWSARVLRAFTDAGLEDYLELVPIPATATDPTLLSRAAEPVLLADRPDGMILVQPVSARSLAGVVELDPAIVAYAPEWVQQLPTANVVELEYGEPAATLTAEDEASTAIYGPIPRTVTTTIKNAPEATAIASAIIARQAWARWVMQETPLLEGLELEVGATVELSLLPAAAPFDPWTPILEGWRDSIVSDGDELEWTMTLSLSDPLLSGVALSWENVPAEYLWNTINPTVEWVDAITLAALEP